MHICRARNEQRLVPGKCPARMMFEQRNPRMKFQNETNMVNEILRLGQDDVAREKTIDASHFGCCCSRRCSGAYADVNQHNFA